MRRKEDSRRRWEDGAREIGQVKLGYVREKVGGEQQETLGFEGTADASDGRWELLLNEGVGLGSGDGWVQGTFEDVSEQDAEFL